MKVASALRTLQAALAVQWRSAPAASLVATLLTLVSGLGAAAGGWLMKALHDELAKGPEASPLRTVLLAVAGASVAAAAAAVLHATGYASQVVRWKVTLAVEQALFKRVSGWVGLRELETPSVHAQLRLAEQAAQEAPQQLSELGLALLRATAAIGSSAVVVWWVSPAMVIALLLAGAVGLISQWVRTRRAVEVLEGLAQSARWRDYHRALLLDPRAAKELRLYGLGEVLLSRLMAALGTSATRETALARAQAVTQGGLALLSAAVTAAGAVLVAQGALRGRFQLGDVSLFLAAAAGVQAASASLVMQSEGASRSLLLFRNYLNVVQAPALQARALPPAPPLRRGVELRDVWFRYDPDGPWVLQGVNLHLRAGETIGLVGANGAGKSTLVKLLCRFWEVDRGQVLWDGVDVRELDPAGLRARLGATVQDFMTYDATAADNIGFGDPRHLTDLARLRAAAGRVGLDAKLSGLPRGYQTLLSRVHTRDEPADAPSSGVLLSGGEWQRLALARTLLRSDADLLILDEPSSGLDPDAEARLGQTLRQHAQGKTRLLISHRLNALRDADRIAVLAGGRIAEEGHHDALMRAGGLYARLFSLQARGYRDPPASDEARPG